MGRAPCCDKANVKKGPWSPEEDSKLKDYIEKNGTGGNWIALPQKAGLKRCGKSCRLRWLNYLRPNIKHGEFSDEEDRIICSLYANIGSRWSIIAAQLPGRTDNDIKNYWNTKLKKKLMGLLPPSHHHHHHQRKPQTLIQSSLQDQNPQFSSSILSHHHQQPYRSEFYTSPSSTTISFTGLDQPSSNSNPPTCSTTNYPFLQEASMVGGPMMQQYYYMLGSEGSCSTSSDGSCGTHGCRDMKQQEEMGFHHHQQHQNYVSNNNGGIELEFCSNKLMGGSCEQNMMNQYWTTAEKGISGYFGESPFMDYGIEDIKQLISSTSSSSNHHLNNSSNNNYNNNGMMLFNSIEENKREEKGMMYYYY